MKNSPARNNQIKIAMQKVGITLLEAMNYIEEQGYVVKETPVHPNTYKLGDEFLTDEDVVIKIERIVPLPKGKKAYSCSDKNTYTAARLSTYTYLPF